MTSSTGIYALLVVTLVASVANGKSPQKIVSGTTAAPGEFPYQASLRIRGVHVCGGTIISKRHIITAAHCVTGLMEELSVASGSISSTRGQIHTVSAILYNQEYDTDDQKSPNDIAVVALDDDIPFNRYQNMIALPSGPVPDGAIVTVSGWGYVSATRPRVVETLKKVQLRTISGIRCQEMFGEIGTIYTNQICTYVAHGVGTCGGDSGGPLVYNNELAGVVSWGQPCAVGLPDVFTSVYDHLPWLNEVINIV